MSSTTIPLGPGPVIPSLTAFVQNNFTSLLSAKSTEDFNSVFDGFFSAHVNVTLNGKNISRADYSKQLSSLNLSTGALGQTFEDIAFEGTVEVSNVNVPGVQTAGTVGTFLTAKYAEKLLVLGAPEQENLTASINVVISNSDKLSRKVVSVNQIMQEVRAPITLPTASST